MTEAMVDEPRITRIKKAIADYAVAYNRLEKLQRSENQEADQLIPIGDQKTGAIGEFFVDPRDRTGRCIRDYRRCRQLEGLQAR